MINLSQEFTDIGRSSTQRTGARVVDITVPQKIGKYQIGELLGRGACGIVHKAYDPFIQRHVSIKISKAAETNPEATSGTSTQNFFAEAYAAGHLQHPHIVSLFDAGVEADLNYIVMEYVQGETLDRFTKGQETMALERVIDIISKCCKALDYSHSQGIVHRDIKPSNIMITPDGDTKIMDFSIALMNAQPSTDQRNPTIGTPGYMSPEQVLGKDVGASSDLYSIAAVMFEMLIGRRIYYAKTMRELFLKIIREPVPRMADLRPDLPAKLGPILEKALRKKPSDRYKNCTEFAMALSRVGSGKSDAGRGDAPNKSRDMLRNLNFFNDFSDTEIDEVLDASTLVQFKSDNKVITEGEKDDGFYIIVVGSVGVYKGDILLDTLREGDCFGELGFLMQAKRMASVIAKRDLLVLKVNTLVLDQLPSDTQLRYYRIFAATMATRLALTSARLGAVHSVKRGKKG